MSYSLSTLRASVANLLSKNNTTTSSYDISTSLNVRVKNVILGYRKVGELQIEYPAIWVELKSDSEDFAQLGKSSRRNIIVSFDVVSEVSYGMGNYDGRELSDTESITLAQNIKNLYRNFITLSNTVDSLIVIGTEYDQDNGITDTWNSSARVSLQIKKLIS